LDLIDLYDRLAPELYAVALRVTGNRDAACAALEDAFADLRTYDARFGSAEAWLVRTVRQHALMRQDRSVAGSVEPSGGTPTPRQLVEEAFYRGRTAGDLARAYALGENDVRRMLRDGIADLRRQFAPGRHA
jgi:DNA-directed RNA polymerase specialized sigma24 family protein